MAEKAEKEEFTQIQITKETAQQLHKLKQLGDTYNDVIGRLLKQVHTK